jgi:hypothetical protein
LDEEELESDLTPPGSPDGATATGSQDSTDEFPDLFAREDMSSDDDLGFGILPEALPDEHDTFAPEAGSYQIGVGDTLPPAMPGAENDEVVGFSTSEVGQEPPFVSAGQLKQEPTSVPIKDLTRAKSALLLDVTPRGLGIGTAGGFCDAIIERNAAIPVEQSRVFVTSADNQTQVAINIFQGESRKSVENTQLGQVLLTNLRPAPRGTIKIRVTFEIDTDGILGVAARNEETNEAQHAKIVLTGGMDESQVQALVEKYAEQ